MAATPALPAEPATDRKPPATAPPNPPASTERPPTPTAPERAKLAEPISGALTRITKKPFGIKVSPEDSLVSPERFSGYHTGVDLETTPEEQSGDVTVFAVCAGALALKEFASGYGGLVVERCRIDGSDIMVVYGHLRLASVTADAGQSLQPGDVLGVLGTGYSRETDGERKHLHLGIHRGTQMNIRGYVPKQDELKDWVDVVPMLESR